MTGLILGLAMIQVMLLAGLAVSREREEGSFDMMLMTPLTPVEILIGKSVPPIVIGVLQSAMIFAVCRWWFDIPFAGSLALLFGVVLLFAASIVGLALMISAWAQTLQQSVVACFILLLPSLVLSGLMTPTAAMPEWMQTITILNPVRYGILVVRMIYFENAGISEIAPYLRSISARRRMALRAKSSVTPLRPNSKPSHKHAVSNFRHLIKNSGVKVLSNHPSFQLGPVRRQMLRLPYACNHFGAAS